MASTPSRNRMMKELANATEGVRLVVVGGGPLSDRIGRRLVLKYAAVLFFVSAVASALAPSFLFLVAFLLVAQLPIGHGSIDFAAGAI